MTATTTEELADVVITLNGDVIANESSPTWVSGANTLIVTVTMGASETVYTVTVTKS